MSDITDEMVERAAKAIAGDWNPGRDPILSAMFRDYAQSALAAVLPDLIRQAKAEAWDEGATSEEIAYTCSDYCGSSCRYDETVPREQACRRSEIGVNPYRERGGE